jgi:hypothetical protein
VNRIVAQQNGIPAATQRRRPAALAQECAMASIVDLVRPKAAFDPETIAVLCPEF